MLPLCCCIFPGNTIETIDVCYAMRCVTPKNTDMQQYDKDTTKAAVYHDRSLVALCLASLYIVVQQT